MLMRTVLIWCLISLFSTGFIHRSRSQADEHALPEWFAVDDPDIYRYQFSKQVIIKEPVLSGQLKFASDFARASVTINDRKVLNVEPYCQLQSLDVTQWLIAGTNVLKIDVQRLPGPSAVAFDLNLRLSSDRSIRVPSNKSWIIESTEQASPNIKTLGKVRAELWGEGRRDITLSSLENYEQWRQASSIDGRAVKPKFWTAPGFEVELLRTADADEGSWISLTFDERGRAILSREDQGLLRMTLDKSYQSVERVETIDVDLKECRGLVFQESELFANANNSKTLYRLRINEAGQVEDLTPVREFPGSVGHGRNDLTIDNGWLYEINGDSVDLPNEDILDLTSPVRNGSSEGSRREGHLLRMQMRTGQWQVVCGGLRNPYGIAVLPGGDPVTLDADNEYDMGTPWYRPTRVVALLQGGDVGYRTAGNKLPPRFHDQPENVPPVLTIGRSSPTAVFCDPALAFPPPYRNALFLLDWTYGRILAVHLVPRGASWRAQAELFLQGRPLNVTDVARGPDGAMYVITGGRKTQSSLYRIAAKTASDPIAANLRAADETHEQDTVQFSSLQLAKRKKLEEVSRNQESKELKWILENLANADPAIRHAARIAVERLPIEQWRILIQETENEALWLYGSLSLAQSMDSAEAQAILDRWLDCKVASFGLSERFVWLRLCELCLRADKSVVAGRNSEIIKKLMSIWPDSVTLQVATEGTTIQLRQRLAQVLGQLNAQDAIPLVSKDLFSSQLQEDKIAGLLALRHQRNGWTEATRRQQFQLLLESERMVGGEGLPKFMEAIRIDSLNSLSDDEQTVIAEVLEAKTDERVESVQARSLIKNWLTEDLGDITSQFVVEGDRERGAKIFKEANCARCHRIGSLGKSVGPDLTFVGRRFNPRDLLESILTPSRSVAENYRLDSVLTRSGTVHIGRILIEGDYRSENLRIQTDPLRDNSIIEVDKREVEEHKQSERSPMPDGLLDAFNRDEIRDLIAYLQNPV